MPRILITGSLGQIGSELSQLLSEIYGDENVIRTDIVTQEEFNYEVLDVLDFDRFNHLADIHDIDWMIHNASILSVTGEKQPHLAMKVNIRGFENAIEVARTHEIRILSPSSIAAFGPRTPMNNTPDFTTMRPNTIYGVSKVYMELLGEYYHKKWQTDFRSLRYPGIISYKTPPQHGTTDYAVAIFYEALRNHTYTSFLGPLTLLPMMYIPDCLKGTHELLKADEHELMQRTYNIAGFSVSPNILAKSIKRLIPDFEISYQPDYRQEIADSWPNSIDDSAAREQWSWKPDFSINEMVDDMIQNLSNKLGIQLPS